MGNRDFVGALGIESGGEQRSSGFGFQVDILADESLAAVAQQGSRQQTGLGQYLESVADAQHIPARAGMGNHVFHDRREAGNGSRTQVIAVRKAARQHKAIALLQVGILVPKFHHRVAQHLAQHMDSILIAIGTGKNNHAKFHRD